MKKKEKVRDGERNREREGREGGVVLIIIIVTRGLRVEVVVN